MKKFWSILCAAILLVVSLCALAACGGVNEVDVDRLLRKCNFHDEIPLEKLPSTLNIDISSDSYSVYGHEVEYGTGITLDYIEGKKGTVTATPTVEGGALNVVIAESDNAKSADKNSFLVVGIPEYLLNRQAAQKLNVTVISHYGNIQIEEIEYANNVTAVTDKGTIYVNDGHAELTTLTSDTGDIYVETEGEKVIVTTDKGNVRFDLTVKDVTVTTDSGNIKGTIEHPQYWYAIDAHSDKGKCNLNKRTSTGEYKLTLSSKTGNINIRFDND